MLKGMPLPDCILHDELFKLGISLNPDDTPKLVSDTFQFFYSFSIGRANRKENPNIPSHSKMRARICGGGSY
jgi:hypothetical protein